MVQGSKEKGAFCFMVFMSYFFVFSFFPFFSVVCTWSLNWLTQDEDVREAILWIKHLLPLF